MKTKLVLDGGMALMGVAFLAAIVTLNAAACAVMAMCAARAWNAAAAAWRRTCWWRLPCAAWRSMAFAVPTLAAINVAHLDGLVCAGWLVLDTGREPGAAGRGRAGRRGQRAAQAAE